MDHLVAHILLIPLLVYLIFQPALVANATQIEETLNLAVYEGQKEASLNGKYDEQIYKKMRDYLVEVHHYDPDKIEIKGTEKLTERGEPIYIEITVPKPMLSPIDIFTFEDTDPFVVEKMVMSEFVP